MPLRNRERYKIPTRQWGYFACLELVLYGIKERWLRNTMKIFDIGVDHDGHRRHVHAKEFVLERIEKIKNPEFICATCGKGYHLKTTYWNHLVTHNLPPYHKTCDHCGEKFDSRKEYAKHYRDKHKLRTQSSSTNLLPCEDCGKTFANLSNLTKHLRRVHLGIKKKLTKTPKPCPTCDKVFYTNENLTYHMNVHTGAKPYKCFYCENAYQNRSNRTNHIKKSHPEVSHQKQKEAVITEEEGQDPITMTFVQ